MLSTLVLLELILPPLVKRVILKHELIVLEQYETKLRANEVHHNKPSKCEHHSGSSVVVELPENIDKLKKTEKKEAYKINSLTGTILFPVSSFRVSLVSTCITNRFLSLIV